MRILELAAIKALGPLPQFTARLKPILSGDLGKLTIRVPLVEHDGMGKYAAKLSLVRVTIEFSNYTMTLFEKVPAIKHLTFISDHRGKDVLSVTLSRPLYRKLKLRQTEEQLGAYQGQFIEPLMAKKISEKKVERLVAKRRRAVYKKVFSLIPRSQLKIDKRLR